MKPEQIMAAIESMDASLSRLEAKSLTEEKLEAALTKLSQTLTTQSNGKDGSGASEQGQHGLCKEAAHCEICRPVVNKAYQMGQETVLAIPGVKEAVEYNQEMAKMGYQKQGWHEAPKALEAVQWHQLMMTPVDTLVEVG